MPSLTSKTRVQGTPSYVAGMHVRVIINAEDVPSSNYMPFSPWVNSQSILISDMVRWKSLHWETPYSYLSCLFGHAEWKMVPMCCWNVLICQRAAVDMTNPMSVAVKADALCWILPAIFSQLESRVPKPSPIFTRLKFRVVKLTGSTRVKSLGMDK